MMQTIFAIVAVLFVAAVIISIFREEYVVAGTCFIIFLFCVFVSYSMSLPLRVTVTYKDNKEVYEYVQECNTKESYLILEDGTKVNIDGAQKVKSKIMPKKD